MIKKIFVLDTNVLLHDGDCLGNFQEHDIMIPMSVIEELDNFKKGNETIHYNARKIARFLDGVCAKSVFNGGMSLGPERGKIYIRYEKDLHEDLRGVFDEPEKTDSRIINFAYHLKKKNTNQNVEVVVVSKDINFRLKAKGVGLFAEDYSTDNVKAPQELYTGKKIEEGVEEEAINRIFSGTALVSEFDLAEAPQLNQYFILRNGKKSVLAACTSGPENSSVKVFRRVERQTAYGIIPKNAEQIFALDALFNPDIPLVTITGKAGTGKTLLALAAGIEKRRDYQQILLARPIVPLSNKDIGFLPGDIGSKLGPYMQPLWDNLGVIRSQYDEKSLNFQNIQKMLDEEKLRIEPLAYIRGRSLVKKYFIVDEAQNLTPHEVKTIITRAGEKTKIIFTGDIHQIDNPFLSSESNGLSVLIYKMQGQKLFAHINLEKGERSELADLAANIL
jgi:PhoH-like ATPase